MVTALLSACRSQAGTHPGNRCKVAPRAGWVFSGLLPHPEALYLIKPAKSLLLQQHSQVRGSGPPAHPACPPAPDVRPSKVAKPLAHCSSSSTSKNVTRPSWSAPGEAPPILSILRCLSECVWAPCVPRPQDFLTLPGIIRGSWFASSPGLRRLSLAPTWACRAGHLRVSQDGATEPQPPGGTLQS